MQKVKTIGLAMLALLAVGAVAAASASAAEVTNIFLAGATSTTFSGTSGAGHLSTTGNFLSVQCKKGKSSGKVEAHKGEATLTFEECTLLGSPCNGLGAAAGTIPTSGTFTSVYDSLSPLLPAILLTIKEVHIECPSLGVLLLVKGNLLLLFGTLTSGTEVTSTTLVVTVKEGKPGDTKYWETSSGAEKHPLLLTSENGGEFKESGDESAENKVTYAAMVGTEF